MKYDVITIGGATEDIAFYTKEGMMIDNKEDILMQKLIGFEYGAKINIDKPFFGFGGGATNTAVCFSRLGFKTACLSAIGDDDRGERIMENLNRCGIDPSLIQKIKGANSGLSFVLICQNNERIIFSNRGANSQLAVSAKDLSALKQAKWLYISSMSGKWQANIEKIASLKNSNIAWNPGHFQLKDGHRKINRYLKNIKVLILNKDEALELVLSNKKFDKSDKDFLNKTENLIKVLLSWGPEIVAITNGRMGAHAGTGDKLFFQPAYKISQIIDKTGVGDAFGASFTAGLEVYGDIQKALALGVKNAAKILAKQGAQNGAVINNIT